MKFQIKYHEAREVQKNYPSEEFAVARTFASRVYKEFGEFVKAIVLFGSANKGKEKPNDIDILIVLDDVRIEFSEEIVQTYRIITQKIISDTDVKRLHVQSMKFSSFWEYVRAGDPVATNILRYGIALVDTGFFDPLQQLLDQGRIRPTPESISTYFAMAPASLEKAEGHLLAASVDLYWSVINSAHAALMHYGEVPPSPEHVVEIMQKTLVKEKKISQASLKTMIEMYALFKAVTTRNKKTVSGKEYDAYKIKAGKFVKEMDKFIRKEKKK
ncbi:MAG: DNA polymerase beta protein [archaeon GW2011_AR17]|nr:MAG: DNA polymerase beta protein [archaeon GW2011_AR17]MBS3154596.1 nucleotidyltransferase domain-containing protein [Candidatus Woesearchaeota archaeon]HIH14745.1 nucleotidyltransferase domain-containing protein [Nanoarchaeota archaeon]HIH58523.1 nucleotidyltransferase domain-containing protein [Nanoarchaeota archaeon]HII14292.1 nucleotidyltransferase domain-containing protein [Nanoarchaeota archaeon]